MVGSNEQFISKRKADAQKTPAGTLSKTDQEIVGKPVRIEIPFVELNRIREVGEMLAEFNASIQDLTSRAQLAPRSVLLELHREAWMLNQRIKKLYPEVYPSRAGRGLFDRSE